MSRIDDGCAAIEPDNSTPAQPDNAHLSENAATIDAATDWNQSVNYSPGESVPMDLLQAVLDDNEKQAEKAKKEKAEQIAVHQIALDHIKDLTEKLQQGSGQAVAMEVHQRVLERLSSVISEAKKAAEGSVPLTTHKDVLKRPSKLVSQAKDVKTLVHQVLDALAKVKGISETTVDEKDREYVFVSPATSDSADPESFPGQVTGPEALYKPKFNGAFEKLSLSLPTPDDSQADV